MYHTMGVRIKQRVYDKLKDMASERRRNEDRNVPLAELIDEALESYIHEQQMLDLAEEESDEQN